MALAMNKIFIVQTDHDAIKNGAVRSSQISPLDCDAAQGADDCQTQPFPTKMHCAAVLLSL